MTCRVDLPALWITASRFEDAVEIAGRPHAAAEISIHRRWVRWRCWSSIALTGRRRTDRPDKPISGSLEAVDTTGAVIALVVAVLTIADISEVRLTEDPFSEPPPLESHLP
jgi:hypothetical protein